MEAIVNAFERQKRIAIYGLVWKDRSLVDIEMACFVNRLSVQDGGMGAAEHFRRLCKILWPKYLWLSDDPDIPYESQWNDRMLDACLESNWVAVSGPSSAGKSAFFALWALVNWIPRFHRCAVIVTSTTKSGAKTRIWGQIEEFYGKLPFQIGKLVKTSSIITANDGSELTKGFSERSSIMLIAPDAGKNGDRIGKLIGLHNEFVYIIGDEYSDMSESVANACENLRDNPNFHAAFLANFSSTFDPFGRQCLPKSGHWSDADVNDLQWPTERGICLHLSGEKTPNRFSVPPDKYGPLGYQRWSEVQARQAAGQAMTASYWRFVLSFPAPKGTQDTIYTDLELAKNHCYEQPVWLGGNARLAALDPAVVSGGDDFMAVFGTLGQDKDRRTILCFDEFVAIHEDVSDKEDTIREQVAKAFVAECRKRGISARQVAVDCTGAGQYFADFVEREFGERGILRVVFSEEASDLPINPGSDIRCRDRYTNVNAELWHSGVYYVQNQQLMGVKTKQAEEMCNRKEIRRGGKVAVEGKSEYKKRTGQPSPDSADAGLLLLFLARSRFGFAAGDAKLNSARITGASKAAERFRALYKPPPPGTEPVMRWGG